MKKHSYAPIFTSTSKKDITFPLTIGMHVNHLDGPLKKIAVHHYQSVFPVGLRWGFKFVCVKKFPDVAVLPTLL
jgi:hypothetical protein